MESGKSLLDQLGDSTSLPVEFHGSSTPGTSAGPTSSEKKRTPSGTHEDHGTRRSSRAIKRKRFDDEIVDSPVFSPGAALAPATPGPSGTTALPPQTPTVQTPQTPSSTIPPPFHIGASSKGGKGIGKGMRNRLSSSSSLADTIDPSMANSRASLSSEFKQSNSKKSNKKKKKSKKDSAMKDLGRWKPTDDLALLTAVQQTGDLCEVYRGIKFTCHFTLSEIQERWYALLYNPLISKLAVQAMKNLHPEVILEVQRKTLLSKQEKELLCEMKSTSNPSMSDFSQLIQNNPVVFHHARTARFLQHIWQSMKQYQLLPDQAVQPLPKDNHILNFFDAEDSINDGELYEAKDHALDEELIASNRKALKEIRHLEDEVKKWQVIVDKVSGNTQPDFDNQTLAVLRGRLVRYLMRSKEITLGRTSKNQAVDVDLKLEGPAWKISRRQGFIKLNNSGEFFICNEGKRCLFVDGKPVRRGNKALLGNNSVLEIVGLRFVFLINQDLIEAIRQEAAKAYHNS